MYDSITTVKERVTRIAQLFSPAGCYWLALARAGYVALWDANPIYPMGPSTTYEGISMSIAKTLKQSDAFSGHAGPAQNLGIRSGHFKKGITSGGIQS